MRKSKLTLALIVLLALPLTLLGDSGPRRERPIAAKSVRVVRPQAADEEQGGWYIESYGPLDTPPAPPPSQLEQFGQRCLRWLGRLFD